MTCRLPRTEKIAARSETYDVQSRNIIPSPLRRLLYCPSDIRNNLMTANTKCNDSGNAKGPKICYMAPNIMNGDLCASNAQILTTLFRGGSEHLGLP